jgi:ABC-2 type transport system permease protein
VNAPVREEAIRYQTFSPARVGALVLRHVYLLRSSWPRLLEVIYWPLVQMVMWGFLQSYLNQQSGMLAQAGGTLIGAILLWDILVRSQLGFSVSFLEEMWSRNLANLLITPLKRSEFLVGLMSVSMIRLAIGILPVTLLAIWFFGFNLWGLGLALGAFFANLLLTAWAVGMLASGLVLRNGLGAEGFVWTIMFLALPICCVFYPVETLPEFLRWVAWSLPPTYVFEGMRALMFEGVFRADLMVRALAINGLFILAAWFVFVRLLDSARRAGSLLSMGE